MNLTELGVLETAARSFQPSHHLVNDYMHRFQVNREQAVFMLGWLVGYWTKSHYTAKKKTGRRRGFKRGKNHGFRNPVVQAKAQASRHK